MDKHIAFCGLECSSCEAFIATAKNDAEMKKKVAAKWTEEYHTPLKPEDIHCQGCNSTAGVLFGYCLVCEIRACGLKRGLTTCAACPEYACDKLAGILAKVPAAKATLESLRKSR